tara:strand:+ start:1609 stop:2019 length:411 start_codon:yes stop_codon:yes gene_type:complete
MKYNFLLLENQNLFYERKDKLSSLNKLSLNILEKEYTLISNTIPKENSLISEVVDSIKNNLVLVNFEKVTSALKEVKNNQIISHLKREDYRKISYPVITETEHLKNYLIKNSFLFNIDSFLNSSSFQGIEIDSWYQ